MPARWLNPGRLCWLVIEYPKHTVDETVRLFNEEFGTRITKGQLKSAQSNHFPGVYANSGVKPFKRAYTDEELSFLRQRIPSTPYDDLIAQFQERFGRRLTKSMIQGQGRRLGVRRLSNPGRFPKGHVPANKGRTGFCPPGAEKGHFKKGHTPANTLPMFSERVDERPDKTGVVLIKVPGPTTAPSHIRIGANQTSHWAVKARWVWEREKGPIPDGHIVIHLDGDFRNCDIGNLDCVPRGVLAVLNNPLHTPAFVDRDTNPARVRLAQLKLLTARRART